MPTIPESLDEINRIASEIRFVAGRFLVEQADANMELSSEESAGVHFLLGDLAARLDGVVAAVIDARQEQACGEGGAR
jgi:hypothetical protein